MKTPGVAVWLNNLQFEKLKELEKELKVISGKELTPGETVMVSALVAKAFIALFSLGIELIETGKIDPDQILNMEYIQQTVNPTSASLDEISKVGRHIEKVFIQLDTLGLLKK